MVEEAAGTSTYETKRIEANKTIERKDFKLNELNTVYISKILRVYIVMYIIN